MALPAEAMDLIKRFEGCLKRIADGRYQPYLCPANVPTVGWGTTRYPDGRRVALKDMPITLGQADAYLAHEVAANEADCGRLTTARLHPFSRGALVSFIYNCGSGAYRGSTLRKRVNDGAWSDVPRELAKWRMGGGRVLAGLVRRRADEGALFMQGVRLHNGRPPIDAEPAPAPAVALAPVPAPVVPPARPPWWRAFLGWWRK